MTTPNRILRAALDIGEGMLICGAEVSRVEDSIERILKAYGAKSADVFTITSSIVVTMDWGDDGPYTQTRRIRSQSNDLHRLNAFNALSRDICEHTPNAEFIDLKIAEIQNLPQYPRWAQCLFYALISSMFSLFFGGNAYDALISAAIGVILKELLALLARMDINRILSGALCAFASGLLAMGTLRLGVPASFDMIAIGDIMLVIPGINLTNALRDMLSGDTLSGIMRLLDAILLAVAVAIGFALAGGML